MTRLVHLSDIHLQIDWRQRSLWSSGWRGAPGRFELHGLGRLRRFHGVHDRIRRLVDRALGREPHHVLLTGDLTALGDEVEFAHVRSLFAPLLAEGRLTVIPGNHDRYTDTPRSRVFERMFASELKSEMPEHADARGYPFVKLLGKRLALVGLDSTRVNSWGHYLLGRLGRSQLSRLGRVLDDVRLAGRTILVLTHHGPVGPSGRFNLRESGLVDAGRLLRILRGRPVVVAHGHSHHRYWHRARGGAPHTFGGGSSTEGAGAGFWQLDIDTHRLLEATAHPLA
jgi:3',5'-cyclic AMP phosphodiesterase CpdA